MNTLLVKRLANYASYHNNPINKFIHVICVPIIFWSALVLLAYTGPLLNFKILNNYYVNGGFIMISAFAIYYTIMDIFAGVTYSVVMGIFWTTSLVFYSTVGFDTAWKYALFIHIAGWIFQFIGHGVFEGRKPTLLDDVTGVATAPLFTWLEILFALGYRKHIRSEIQKSAAINIANWKLKKEKLRKQN